MSILSNYAYNKEAIRRFREEMKDLFEDLSEVDKRCLNKAVNLGMRKAKELTNVGSDKNPGAYKNPVEFTTRDGTKVSFKTATTKVGGFMRKSWKSPPAVKLKSGGVQKVLVNHAAYAMFVNDGHVKRNKKGGPIKGFVPGQYILEKAVKYTDKKLVEVFEEEIQKVKQKHDC